MSNLGPSWGSQVRGEVMVMCTLAGGDTPSQNKYMGEWSGLREEQRHTDFPGGTGRAGNHRGNGRSNLKGPVGPGVRVAPDR